jgi:nucleoside triphosphatase
MNNRPAVTIGALVFYNNKLLLVKSPKWHGKYIVPCGHVEFKENLKDAVRREVFEETALNVNNIKFLKIHELIGSKEYHDPNRHFVCVNFVCEADNDNVMLNKEGDSHVWVEPEKALEFDLDSVTRASVEKYLCDFAINK